MRRSNPDPEPESGKLLVSFMDFVIAIFESMAMGHPVLSRRTFLCTAYG